MSLTVTCQHRKGQQTWNTLYFCKTKMHNSSLICNSFKHFAMTSQEDHCVVQKIFMVALHLITKYCKDSPI